MNDRPNATDLATADTSVQTTPDYRLDELKLESRMGGEGHTQTREVRRIDVSHFEERRAEIADQLWSAAVEVGFFQLVNHGIDVARVRQMFADSARFFAMPQEVKSQYAMERGTNAGWEYRAQVRPSTGTPDQKESYQITRPRMEKLWPTEAELPGFKAAALDFENRCWALATQVLSCFAEKLGFERDFFTQAHDPKAPDYQSTLRLLHYFAMPEGQTLPDGVWRGGAHTDFNCLTLLFQRTGQGGLQVLPGKEAEGEAWTEVEPADEVITCNIGDMLMRWSDDQLPSNFHRVRNPRPDEYQGARYSIAFFAQANRSVMIEGLQKKREPITAGDFLTQRVQANYGKY